MRTHYLLGVDEVGRGPLAGPLSAAALLLPTSLNLSVSDTLRLGLPALRDSKRLSEGQRLEWLAFLKGHPQIFYAVAHVPPSLIDRLNVAQAADLAATRAVSKVLARAQEKGVRIFNINGCLDYGLTLREEFSPEIRLWCAVKKGDELVPAVSLASIVAKVYRDRLMDRLHRRAPDYAFDRHKGYGTRLHYEKIRLLGPSLFHRLSFLNPKNL